MQDTDWFTYIYITDGYTQNKMFNLRNSCTLASSNLNSVTCFHDTEVKYAFVCVNFQGPFSGKKVILIYFGQ